MKLFLKIVVFIVLLGVLDFSTGLFIEYGAKNHVRDQRILNLIDGKVKADIIVIGSSRAFNNVNTDYITNYTNWTAYNFGIPGSNPEFHAFMLELILENRKDNLPKKVIYNIDGKGSIYELPGVVFRKDYLYPYLFNNLIRNEAMLRQGQTEFIADVSLTYRNSLNFLTALNYYFDGKEEYDPEVHNITKTGFNPLPNSVDTNKYNLKRFDDFDSIPNHDYVKSLKLISTICDYNNIELILVSSPINENYEYNELDILSKLMGNRPIYSVNLDSFLNQGNFYNSGHLNEKGSIEFTKGILEFIKN